MALTAAEKKKRYRERIEKDPEKYEKYRKKNIERLKRRRKMISELDEKEKTIQRDHTEKTTKKTVKTEKNGTITQLLRDFENDIKPFKKHYFNNIHQQEKYQYIINNLKENEAVVICDFSENYETKLSEEIQSMHFGASKSQITLHTGMVYLQELSQSFCTVSQNNIHQPPAIWARLLPVLKMIKDDFQVTTIHFYSDGPTSQYRRKNNFYLIDLFTQKLELEYVTWSFDGIGGSVKRVLDRQVFFGKDIREASDA
ncbi:unnamed protein product [Euphydryas editha]|uniref:Uncharacterized protein n=1 Tax=Euphydryas editha TaxID=104508 RepID=A0AAU9UQD4_EUPED|nr:unnamed protein product [Euphydryas editha]